MRSRWHALSEKLCIRPPFVAFTHVWRASARGSPVSKHVWLKTPSPRSPRETKASELLDVVSDELEFFHARGSHSCVRKPRAG